ncbi:hypothetical protein Clacol_009577 [Clathrus columnatus]|uniref:Uncharacterized protein n=1 Tax=Clathrus columnatus TaxID=1419009 RepID=A0AAV5AKV9_9AGAM|nr:hypothetical protein Clacol_009577 [Clathrus columnatus]
MPTSGQTSENPVTTHNPPIFTLRRLRPKVIPQSVELDRSVSRHLSGLRLNRLSRLDHDARSKPDVPTKIVTDIEDPATRIRVTNFNVPVPSAMLYRQSSGEEALGSASDTVLRFIPASEWSKVICTLNT